MTQSARKIVQEMDPICVDLDESLVSTDTLWEQILSLCRTQPWQSLKIPFWLLFGKAMFKSKLAAKSALDVSQLPYNPDVFEFLVSKKRTGHPLFLVSGANQQIVNSVSDHLGIFDGAFGSSDKVNLIGREKATLLNHTFGSRKYLYVGDSSADLHVWKNTNHAFLVNPSTSLVKSAQLHTDQTTIISRRNFRLTSLVEAMRPHQWIKNSLVFIPILTAHAYGHWALLAKTISAFFALCFTSSATYVVNDLLDLQSDRNHPEKSKRPFASGKLPVSIGFIFAPILYAIGLGVAATVNNVFLYLILAYVFVANLYSFKLKDEPIVDILILVTLFCGRIAAGGVAASIDISNWLIAFSGFFFLSLAIAKRCAELRIESSRGKPKIERRGYLVEDLPVLTSLGTAAGYSAIIILCLYINSETARKLYPDHQLLWLECPVLLYWITKMWLSTSRGLVTSDPIRYAIKGKSSWLTLGIASAIWVFARILN